MEKDKLRIEWEKRIASYRASGLTQVKWCEVNDIKVHQFKYWLKRIEGSTSNLATPNSWTSVIIEEPTPQNDMLEVKVGEVSIEVKPGFNPALFADVIKALKSL